MGYKGAAAVVGVYRPRRPQKRGRYGKRKFTIEPALGIITQVLGFQQFLLRGS